MLFFKIVLGSILSPKKEKKVSSNLVNAEKNGNGDN